MSTKASMIIPRIAFVSPLSAISFSARSKLPDYTHMKRDVQCKIMRQKGGVGSGSDSWALTGVGYPTKIIGQ
ncbi:hypothetical protein V6N12_071257 [Hibiscus sabdariffa]|uniref:Uncharacterized protein n=1 Tax=Hibiscus sabdariffa TaxID=183260 RepID=A0ABR2FJH1_9ROSI